MRDWGRCHLIGSLLLGWAILLSSSYLTTAIAMTAQRISYDQFGYVYQKVGGDLADYGWGAFVAGWVVVLRPAVARALKRLEVPSINQMSSCRSSGAGQYLPVRLAVKRHLSARRGANGRADFRH